MNISFSKISTQLLGMTAAVVMITGLVAPIATAAQTNQIDNSTVSALDTAQKALSDESCVWMQGEIRPGEANDVFEVTKLQSFLKYFENNSNLAVTGQYDQPTIAAVKAYQTKYSAEILSPWGYTQPTGVVYITTRQTINEQFCDKVFPLTESEQQEISMFRNTSVTVGQSPVGQMGSDTGSMSDDNDRTDENQTEGTDENDEVSDQDSNDEDSVAVDEDDENEEENNESDEDESDGVSDELAAITGTVSSLGAAVTTLPQTGTELAKCIFYLLIMLAIVYIVVSIIVGSQENIELTLRELRTKKLLYFAIGAVIAAILSLILGIYCVVLPLIVVVIGLAITLLFFTRGSDV